MLERKPSVIFKIIYELSQNKNNNLSISYLCRASKVSKSGYYNWLKSKPNRDKKEAKDQADFTLIEEAYNYRGYKKVLKAFKWDYLETRKSILMLKK